MTVPTLIPVSSTRTTEAGWDVAPAAVTDGDEPRAAGMGPGCGPVMFRAQLARLPPSPLESSWTRNVQTPFGFSPMNAPSGSSGTSVATAVPFVYTVSPTSLLPANVSAGNGAGLPGSA